MEAPMLQWPLAVLAGVATVASPCVLPVLPMLLGASVGRTEQWRPLCIVAGFVLVRFFMIGRTKQLADRWSGWRPPERRRQSGWDDSRYYR